MGEPIPAIEIGGLICQGIMIGQVQMREDEVVDRFGLQYLAGKSDLGLFFVSEAEFLVFVGFPTLPGEKTCDAESNAGV